MPTEIVTVPSFDKLKPLLNSYLPEERTRIQQAAEYAAHIHQSQKRDSGEPYITHPLSTAKILIDMNLDAPTIMAGLLHDVLEDSQVSEIEMEGVFGKEVTSLVRGVSYIRVIPNEKKEHIIEMLKAMTEDVRVVLIKLADKLHNMTTLDAKLPKRRKIIAQETYDIFVPLAAQLGISWMSDLLKNLSIKYLAPKAYEEISHYLQQKSVVRYLQKVEDSFRRHMKNLGFPVEIQARSKQIHSIYEKLLRYEKMETEIYDTIGIRIICQHIPECYTVLGVIHQIWPPLEGRFKDYIALPKSNRYQSLHTVLLGPEGKPLEVQIRTQKMHQTAEYGVAAHFLYKQETQLLHRDLPFLQRIKEHPTTHSVKMLNEIMEESLQDSIHVFTPKGDKIELPRGSTAIDFAYHIHTEVGNHAATAQADELPISLFTPLTNTQIIRIATTTQAHPTLHWLQFTRTSRARSRIRSWLNHHTTDLLLDKGIIVRFKDTPHPDAHVSLASCCKPSFGDPIIGYFSSEECITVHRQDCKTLLKNKPPRYLFVNLEWEESFISHLWKCQLHLRSTRGIFSQLEKITKHCAVNLMTVEMKDGLRNIVEAGFTFERYTDLKKVIEHIQKIPELIHLSTPPPL